MAPEKAVFPMSRIDKKESEPSGSTTATAYASANRFGNYLFL
jgi:hypothetical protein